MFNSASYLSPGGGRNGYLRIDAGPGETINGIRLDNQAGNHEGILYDHLACRPVQSAAVPDSGGTSMFATGRLRRWMEYRDRRNRWATS